MILKKFQIIIRNTITALFCLSLYMSPATAGNVGEMSEDELKQFIQEYLMENPDVIINSLETFQARQEAITAQYQNQALKGYIEQAKNSDAFPTTGPDDADVTMIEFFDYQCGYCKQAFSDMMSLVEDDQKIKVIFVELPILGPVSKVAALAAMGADKQGKYIEFHTALMEVRGRLSENKIFEIAEDFDLNLDQLRADMKSEEFQTLIDENLKSAQMLGINGTPAFIIGNQLFPGAIPREQMEAATNAYRDANS